eukprot:23460-Karenia_brevis.AAC.1
MDRPPILERIGTTVGAISQKHRRRGIIRIRIHCVNDNKGCKAKICMACNGESRAMEKHIKLCSRSDDHMVPSMHEYSPKREHFLAP